MYFEQRLMELKPHPRSAIADIPIRELCELIRELHKKIEQIEDRLDELETNVWLK